MTTCACACGKLSKKEVMEMKFDQVHSTIARTMLADGFHVVIDFDKSQGSWLVDGITGKKYLDFFSYFASWTTGHNHPKLNDKDFIAKIGRIAVQNPSNSDVYSLEMAQFVATFERVAMPPEMKHVFFVTGGALAVENALKCAFDWKVRKNLAAGKGEKGEKVIHFKNCFHGRSGYTLSLTSTDPVKTMYFPKFGSWPRIDPPACIFPMEGDNLSKVIAAEKKAVDDITAVLEKDADDVAAILIETVMGEGGDNQFRPEFLRELRRLSDKYGVFLIFDEVQCGMGMTGKMWAWQHYGVVPDAVCFGKKAQVCGFMATNRVDEIPDNVFKVCSRINSTWGGNLTDMVRAQRILEIIEEEDLCGNVERVGKYFLEKLKEVQAKHPKLISNARGIGFMCAFDLPTPELRNHFRVTCLDKNVFVLPCGTRSIRFRPALVATKEDIDAGLKCVLDVLAVMDK